MMKTFLETYNEVLAGETVVEQNGGKTIIEQSTVIRQQPKKKFSAKDFLHPPKVGTNEQPWMRPGHDDPEHVFSQAPPLSQSQIDPGKTTIDHGKTTAHETGPISAGEFKSFVADLGNRLGGIEGRLTKAGI
ncbi:MAG: hypothetical protein ACW99G_01345 [Candidatus Thorarchaeota archaeon]|jgi:hypothetical protein